MKKRINNPESKISIKFPDVPDSVREQRLEQLRQQQADYIKRNQLNRKVWNE